MADLKTRYPHLWELPRVDPSAWIAPSAQVMCDVTVGAEASIWFNAVVRGDVQSISIGPRSNIQDLCMVHVTDGGNATRIGRGVTVGHSAILHACTVGDNVLVGMGAILLDGCEVGNSVLIGAGSLVPPGMKIPSGSKVIGRPARVIAELTPEEVARIQRSAEHYVALARAHQQRLQSV